jgi:DNA invertase Pin-like site-specific DNA recombinase
MNAAIYARVSTFDQEPENQLQELRRYAAVRGWTAVEYVDRGVSGAKDKRPALDTLVRDAKRRRFDVLVCWRLDRLGRNLKHLITLLEELQSLGVAFVSLAEGIDATTPAGKLQMHILGAIAEFERARIAERVRAGLQRARAQGRRLGRPFATIPIDRLHAIQGMTIREAASALVCRAPPPSVGCPNNPPRHPPDFRPERAHNSGDGAVVALSQQTHVCGTRCWSNLRRYLFNAAIQLRTTVSVDP